MGKLSDGFDLGVGQGSGLVADAYKSGNALGGSHYQPGVVVGNHFDEEISGENFFPDLEFFTMLNVDFVLGGDEKLENLVCLAQGGDSLAQGLGDPGFVAGIGMDDIPADFI